MTIFDYTEIQVRIDNQNRVDAVVSDWMRTYSNDNWVIHLKCFNKEEEAELSEYMGYKYPGIPYFTSRVNFDHLNKFAWRQENK